jgi:hypothetical protein
MKTIFILSFILLLLSFHSNAQQTIDKLNVNQLKLPKESSNKALILDGAGQVKSSSTITDTELGYLEGLTDTLVNLLLGKANDGDVVKLSGNQSVGGVKTFEGKLVASSTVNGSIPCPVMTETQRDAFTPVEGDCVYNSDTLKLNVFDGAIWKDVGGAGGISLWLTANPYNVNDIIIESDKIYRCLIAHTSGTFATDLAASKWVEVSSGLQSPVALADGGTGAVITPTAGSIVYVDADSFEQVSGTAGQVLQSNGSGAPTFVNKSISAKSQNNASVTAEEIQVPNNLLTQVDTNKHLNETGNKNILINPSFEHSTFSTGWTNSAGTFTEDTIVEIDGLKAAKLVLSSQTMSLSQSSTLYASQFADGVQGLASVRVKSDVALKVCSIQAGTVSTSNCVDVQANNKWGLYKVPFILGATSNGISIASSGAVSGTVYIDDAFVGAVDLSATQSFDTTCDTIACQTTFSVRITSGALAQNESVNWINGNCVASPVGTYTCNYNSGIFTDAPNCVATTNGGSGGVIARFSTETNSQIAVNLRTDSGLAATEGFELICQKQGADYTAAIQAQKDFQKSKISSYSSTNADTDIAPYTPTVTTASGTMTNYTATGSWYRDGQFLIGSANITFTGAPGTWQSPFVTIPSGLQIDTSKILNGAMLGDVSVRSTGEFPVGVVYSQSSTLIGVTSAAVTSHAGSVPIVEFALSNTFPVTFASGHSIKINYKVPIVGWQNSNIIIGQFNGLESCTNSYECTDVFSASVGSTTGPVSQENIDWISGNATVTDTSLFTLTFKTGLFTQTPNCAVQLVNNDNTVSVTSKIVSNSSTSISVRTGFSNTGSGFTKSSDIPFYIICQKQGVDYIGKTAKAVASDQNTRTPSVTNSVIYSAKISTAGAVTNLVGNLFSSSCSLSGTNNNRKTCSFTPGFNAVNCNVTVFGCAAEAGGCSRQAGIAALSSSSITTWGTDGAASSFQATEQSIICHGAL